MPDTGAKRLEDRQIEILERSLLGCPKKVIASDFVLSQSSITAQIMRCFGFMGLSCTPSRVPLPVVIAACAKRLRVTGPISRSLSVPSSAPAEKLIQIERPEGTLAGLVPPAEEAIVRLLAEGKSFEVSTGTATSSNQHDLTNVPAFFTDVVRFFGLDMAPLSEAAAREEAAGPAEPEQAARRAVAARTAAPVARPRWRKHEQRRSVHWWSRRRAWKRRR